MPSSNSSSHQTTFLIITFVNEVACKYREIISRYTKDLASHDKQTLLLILLVTHTSIVSSQRRLYLLQKSDKANKESLSSLNSPNILFFFFGQKNYDIWIELKLRGSFAGDLD